MFSAIDSMDPTIRNKCALTLRWLLHVSRMSSTLLMFSSEINRSVSPDSQESGLVCLDLLASARDLSEGPAEVPPEDWAASSSTRGTKERQVVLLDNKPQRHTLGCGLCHHIKVSEVTFICNQSLNMHLDFLDVVVSYIHILYVIYMSNLTITNTCLWVGFQHRGGGWWFPRPPWTSVMCHVMYDPCRGEEVGDDDVWEETTNRRSWTYKGVHKWLWMKC